MPEQEHREGRRRFGLGTETLGQRLVVGAICGLVVGGIVTLALVVFAGAEWGDAAIIGLVCALPVLFVAARWYAAAAIFLGFLEGALIAAGMIAGAIAAIFGALS
jgi:hypothetical protein